MCNNGFAIIFNLILNPQPATSNLQNIRAVHYTIFVYTTLYSMEHLGVLPPLLDGVQV